ncbi:nucleoside deaminase [uncultured Shewanella sp.]|uniref:nucleoside deaminase n=1 Tax=uncultured Shewanella sp. TaxID=173975 RepID=UPI00260971D8|nr:nucleoside deaminase [uncultured Shewanella sp.]
MSRDHDFMKEALLEAKKSLSQGGIPIGSILVIDNHIIARGHNQRVQKNSAILHAEMDCLENAGRLTAAQYQQSTLYSTLSPCAMCSGTSLLYSIPRIVIGENITFKGPEEYLMSQGIELSVLNDSQCIDLMTQFIEQQPTLWNEDIGI